MKSRSRRGDELHGDLRDRLGQARKLAARNRLGAFLITPGPDLRYLTGYNANALERLTCLVVPAKADPLLLVPELERQAAADSPVGSLGLAIVTWSETADPYEVVADLVPLGSAVAVDDGMRAATVLALRAVMPESAQRPAGTLLAELRIRKSPAEIAALQRAGAAIDQVHERVAGFLRPGRSEREVARDIDAAIRDAGHAQTDFVIVASGPNSASPHHECSDRVLRPGDAIVVDIGGTMPDGYRSDSTRTYALGPPPKRFLTAYEVLREAQRAAVSAAQPGITCAELDAVARDLLTAAGLGKYFIHRTGHGIGLDSHEEPYIIEGNSRVLEPGMAFSIEPGFYVPGKYGARIEDIVVCRDQAQDPDTAASGGPIMCNQRPHELMVVPL